MTSNVLYALSTCINDYKRSIYNGNFVPMMAKCYHLAVLCSHLTGVELITQGMRQCRITLDMSATI